MDNDGENQGLGVLKWAGCYQLEYLEWGETVDSHFEDDGVPAVLPVAEMWGDDLEREIEYTVPSWGKDQVVSKSN